MRSLRIATVLILLCGATVRAADQPPPEKQQIELSLDCGHNVTLKLIVIPAGEFMMGSPETLPGLALLRRNYCVIGNSQRPAPPNEQPQHRVRITKPFYMGIYTVTQAQYESLMGTNPSRYKGANRPVEMVSWKDAVDFCKKLSEKTGRQVRLPTEAEWEYACRAGTITPWYTGETISNKQANFRDYWGWAESEVYHSTTPVGSYPPNPWGLYDMLGNVQQWVQDWFDGRYYKVSPVDDPTGPVGGTVHVARGGAWDGASGECRSAIRKESIEPWTERDWTKGFRVVCVCTPEEMEHAPQASELEAFVKARPAPAGTGSALAQAPAANPAPSGAGSGPAATAPETLAQRLDGTFYYLTNSIPSKTVPETFTSEKRKVTVATPNGNVEKEIVYYRNSVGMEFVLVPAGEFLMGTAEEYVTGCAANHSWHWSPDKFKISPTEKPQHKVRITKPFFMGRCPVTYQQYVELMGPHKTCNRGWYKRFNLTNPPVTEVTWYDAMEFCKRMGKRTGRQCRLPTEAEQEYACRAGTTTTFYTGEKFSYKQGNMRPDWIDTDGTKEVPTEKVSQYYHVMSVGSFPPNPWGLYDMNSCVWQWCQDWYDPDYYKHSPLDDPTGPVDPVKSGSCYRKVLRTGGWDNWPGEDRPALRHEAREPQAMAFDYGFRVVCVCTPEEIKEAAKAAPAVPK